MCILSKKKEKKKEWEPHQRSQGNHDLTPPRNKGQHLNLK